MEGIKEFESIKADLNYEQLLCRAIDRCLYFRIVDKYHGFIDGVQALEMSLVDLPNKPLKTELDKFLENIDEIEQKHKDQGLSDLDARAETHISIFNEITKILGRHKMLFRSTLIETNR